MKNFYNTAPSTSRQQLHFSAEAEETSSSQKGLVQDLTGPQDHRLWRIICVIWTENTRTFSELMLTWLERFLTETDQTVHKFVTSHLRILARSLRAITCCRERFTILSYLRLIYGKVNPWTLVRRFLTCQKLALLSRIHTSVCKLCRAIHGYQRVTYTNACDLLRFGHP